MKLFGLTVLAIFFFCFSTVEGNGVFYSYNSEERDKYDLGNSHPNSINSDQVTIFGPKGLKYDPTWESLDSRPLPGWYDSSKIGIFIHWGVYSVPGVESEWFWKTWKDGRPECVEFMDANYPPGFTYQEFAPEFRAEFFNPNFWADLFVRAGAKYVVLTSKHHEGYTMWPSKYSFSWNSMEVGPRRDIVGDLAKEIRTNTTLKFGLYHSLFEFYNPLWLEDKFNNLSTTRFVDTKVNPAMFELVNTYKPEIFWSDGEWEAPSDYWNSKEFLAWLYNESPVKDTVVTNDRWGGETLCKHGGYYTCADRFNPGTLQPHKWENCLTLDKESWGYIRNTRLEDYLSPEELMSIIVQSVSCGGNVLVNVGPTPEGTIPPIQQERLLQMGKWLEVNGEGIYDSIPWTHQNDTLTPGIWYTTDPGNTKVFAFLTFWPGLSVQLGSVTSDPGLVVNMLGYEGELEWSSGNSSIRVNMPRLEEIRSNWVWTLVLSNRTM